jgi:hypothetical protein
MYGWKAEAARVAGLARSRRRALSTAVVTLKVGKLANRIILFAHLAAAAREYGFGVINPAFDEYAEYFEQFKGAVWPRFPVRASRTPARLTRSARHASYALARTATNLLTSLRVRNSIIDFERVTEIDEFYDLSSERFLKLVESTRLIVIQGWGFRDNISFRKHDDLIRELFVPVAGVRQKVDETVSRARSQAGVLVGIHVRRGDYRSFNDGAYFYSLPEYRRVMEEVANLFPQQSVAFVVCSDEDIPSDAFSGLTVELENRLHVVDLYCLAECDYVLGPPSSFSLWASFYGDRPLYWLRTPTAFPSLTDFEVRYPGEQFHQ